MSFNPQYLGFRQTAGEAGGAPDYMAAMKRGLEMAQTSAKTVNTPRQLSEDYLKSVLANQHSKTINKYLDRSEQARIGGLELSNAGKSLENQYAPQNQSDKVRAALDKHNSEEFFKSNPLLKIGGAAGQVGAAQYVKEHPEKFGGSDESDKGDNYGTKIINSLNAATEYKDQQAKLAAKREKAYAYATAPVEGKSYLLAQAAGMGIALDKAVNAFSEGKTIQDLAKENGFDPENLPEPDYLPTKGNVTKLKDRQAALQEMKHLSKFVTDGLGPYAETIFDLSPEQVSDQLQNMNKDKQIKFLAARGIVPELTTMRLMTAGAKTTVSAIKSLQEKSLLNIKALRAGVSKDVWEAAQNLMDKELEQAMGKSIQAYHLKGKVLRGQEEKQRQAEEKIGEEMVDVHDSITGKPIRITRAEYEKDQEQ